MAENNLLHEIVITAIIIKDGKYLITRRSITKKRMPGKWTVPGGHLETIDYNNFPKDIENGWYNVLERALKREVKEEVGLDINNIEYLTSLVAIYGDSPPVLIISCTTNYISGKVKLQEGETDKYAWVSLKEAKKYDLIDGIYDELVMIEKKRKGKKVEWKRFKS